MALFIQDALRSGQTLDSLIEKYHLRTRRGIRYPNLISISYNQIDSPREDPLVQQCRGLVLDEADNWGCVARGFDRFFNYGEGLAASIDWLTARVQTKCDGSLLLLHSYQHKWHVATTGTPDASGTVNDTNLTFAGLFWRTVPPLPPLDPHLTYLFELCCPENRVIIPYDHPQVFFLGARHRLTGQEWSWNLLPELPHPAEFPLHTIDGLLASFAQMNPLELEGYVVLDAAFRRLKVKHPQYVALHHLRGNFSQRALLEVARGGEIPELVATFPELIDQVLTIRQRLQTLIENLVMAYTEIEGIVDQKKFALQATQTACPAALFSLRSGKFPTVAQFFAAMHLDRLAALLGM